MDFEKYTDRARGFVQSAQSLALREGHQQFAPEHVLKVLLDDPEGLAAGLIDRCGGRSREALAAVEASLAKLPKVSGAGAGQLYLAPASRRKISMPRSTPCARVAPPTPPRRRAPMMRSRNMPATSPKPRVPASSIPSSVATTRSAAPSRCSRAAPRTIRC